MERYIIVLNTKKESNFIVETLKLITLRFEEGWVIDPELKVRSLENALVYHFIRYDKGEEPEEKKDKYEDVESIVSVDTNEADQYLQKGYMIDAVYAKTVTLIKKKQKEKIQTQETTFTYDVHLQKKPKMRIKTEEGTYEVEE